ncbi:MULTISPECIES: hypothetical protein [unclassified Leifsonia]|uniref:hypothetical protein n=1 Tax=unclassified Leifsonia TaxID=2663824 RepID=UPI0012FC9263|nr:MULTISPECIES: hypothetical protein [unclassified Leifsonia]
MAMEEAHFTATASSDDGALSVPIAIDVVDGKGNVSVGQLQSDDDATFTVYLLASEAVILASGDVGLSADGRMAVTEVGSSIGAQTVDLPEWVSAGIYSFTSVALFDDATLTDVAVSSLNQQPGISG